MDLLRNAISALLHSFPIELIGECVVRKEEPLIDLIIEKYFSQILKWEDQAHTETEMKLLVDAVNDDWCVSDALHIGKERYSLLNRFPLLLQEFSNKVLILHGHQNPMVRFNDLLRWRCLAINVGEDLLVAGAVAYRDFQDRYKRNRFLWPTVLPHDNIRINAILDSELSDTHAHINASTDVFEFNWLRLMNYPGDLVPSDAQEADRLESSCWQNGMRKHYDTVKPHLAGNKMNHSLLEWSVVAAAVRYMIFCRLRGMACDVSRAYIIEIYNGTNLNFDKVEELKSKLRVMSVNALSTFNGIILDYAIPKVDFEDNVPATPLMVHHGERSLLYLWFHAYFGNVEGIRDDADLMLLYLVIKSKIRREFIQSNSLVGFENFQDYDGVKFQFVPPKSDDESFWSRYRENIYRYAVQTALGFGRNVHLEARVTPGELKSFSKWDYRHSIFSDDLVLRDDKFNPVTFVVHFIKERDTEKADGMGVRHKKTRKNLRKYAKKILETISEKNDKLPSIVGIDAAGSELNCRPEVFAPYFRYLRSKDVTNFTFHAGEDFFDILDGIRTIDEAVCFMDYRFGDRIGHGLALGANVFEFYDNRHNQIVIPAQILLDNLIWLKFKAAAFNIRLNPTTLLFIEEQFRILSCQLGYTNGSIDSIDGFDYYRSMNMRGDLLGLTPKEDLSIFMDSVKWSPVSCGRNTSPSIERLHRHYEYDAQCRVEGRKVVTLKLPSNFADDVHAIQERMLDELERKGIVIETNPSSNIKIGRFSRYDQHPITRFHAIDDSDHRHSMMISINTDDKGIFGTSLRNEFSLIALALRKTRDDQGNLKWSDAQIENYLKKIAHYGNISRFQNVV